MKEIMETILPGETRDRDNFGNRKLIRPILPRAENHGNHHAGPIQGLERRERPERNERMDRNERSERPAGGASNGKKPAPAEQTHAENFYYLKQIQSRTPMVVVLRDGEEIHGIIEWYDRNCIKVNREAGEPNVMIYKPAIKYMYKEGEGS